MRLRCPNCNAETTCPHGVPASQSVCPRCGCALIPAAQDAATQEEICTQCKREISNAEQAYVFDGEVVCAECDQQLRQRNRSMAGANEAEPKPTKTDASDDAPPSANQPEMPQREFGYRSLVGAVVAFLFLVAASYVRLQKHTYEPPLPLSAHYWVATHPCANIYRGLKPSGPQENLATLATEYTRLEQWSTVCALGIIGLLLLIRSFRPRFRLWKGLLVIIGAGWVGFFTGTLAYAFYRWGLEVWWENGAAVLGVTLVGVIGLAPLQWGLRTRERRCKNRDRRRGEFKPTRKVERG